jgi:hypothetical protein
MRLRFILPTINAVAASLLILENSGSDFYGLRPEPTPTLLACYLLNAPIMPLRFLVMAASSRLTTTFCSPANPNACYKAERLAGIGVFLLGIWVLWYLVGSGIESKWKGRRALLPFRTPYRVGLDLALFFTGILCAFVGVLNWKERSFHIPLPLLAYMVWALALTIPYGRDLLLVRKEPAADSQKGMAGSRRG